MRIECYHLLTKMQYFEKHLREDTSYLQVLNKNKLPFEIERVFFVNSSMNKNCIRGGHAHYNCDQLLVCVSGQIQIDLLNRDEEKTITLLEGQEYLHPKMEWADITFKQENSVLLSLCSLGFCEEDYIRDKRAFLTLINTGEKDD